MQRHIYAFDCGTTNWRIYRLTYEETANGLEPLSNPHVIKLSKFNEDYMPVMILLDDGGELKSYGNQAIRQLEDPEYRPFLRSRFKPFIGVSPSIPPSTEGSKGYPCQSPRIYGHAFACCA